MTVGRGAVLAGMGGDLGPVQTDRAPPRKWVLPRHLQHLDQRRLEFRAKPAPEVGQGVVIGVQVARHITKRLGIVGGPFDRAAGKGAGRVAIDQQRQQHRRG